MGGFSGFSGRWVRCCSGIQGLEGQGLRDSSSGCTLGVIGLLRGQGSGVRGQGSGVYPGVFVGQGSGVRGQRRPLRRSGIRGGDRGPGVPGVRGHLLGVSKPACRRYWDWGMGRMAGGTAALSEAGFADFWGFSGWLEMGREGMDSRRARSCAKREGQDGWAGV